MQNKPNFRKAKMNVNSLIIKDYRKKDDFAVQKNKPKTNPILSAVGGLQMNISSALTKDYERNDAFAVQKNKPNSNPIPLPQNRRAGDWQEKRIHPPATPTSNFVHPVVDSAPAFASTSDMGGAAAETSSAGLVRRRLSPV